MEQFPKKWLSTVFIKQIESKNPSSPHTSSFRILKASRMGVVMPVMVPIMLPRPKLISMKKNMTDQKGLAGKWVMASVKAMNARPVPWTAWRVKAKQRHRRDGLPCFTSQTANWHPVMDKFSVVSDSSDLVELILQHTGIQVQLSKAVFLHRLDDAVHLCIVLRRQVWEVDVRGDELSAQHARV